MQELNLRKIIREEIKALNEDRKKVLITINVTDPDDSLIKLITYIKRKGNTGHSFPIIVDPELSEYRKEFYGDGDGPNNIDKITINGVEKTGDNFDEDKK